MKTNGELSGSAYTSDLEYYEFLGAPKRGVIYDWSMRCWVECILRSPKTPSDNVTSADVDAQLKPERFPEPESKKELAAQRARSVLMQNTIERHAAIQATLTAYITEHGPSSIAQMAEATGLNRSTIGPHLSQRHNTIYEKLYVPGHRHKVWNVIVREEER